MHAVVQPLLPPASKTSRTSFALSSSPDLFHSTCSSQIASFTSTNLSQPSVLRHPHPLHGDVNSLPPKMQSLAYPQFPSTTVHLALFTHVKNAIQLRSRLVKAAEMPGQEGEVEREAVNFAFVNAGLICSSLHLKTAIHRALAAQAQNTLRTKTVHSEILWILNPTNNISEAIRRYGVSDTTESLFVIRVSGPDLQDPQSKMSQVVDGTLSPLSDLQNITDWASIRKYHKLNDIRIDDLDQEEERQWIVNVVTSTVAAKDII
ncbi:EKC/KEOPS complex subunit CGI121 [Abortiporus biennis]